MSDILKDITPLRDKLSYNPETGALLWKQRTGPDSKRWNNRHAGKLALNSVNKAGYKTGMIDGKAVRAHRVIWAIVHGEWPNNIDHINGNKADNRLCNLRSVSSLENNRNLSKQKDNTSGHTGVYWYGRNNRWAARICDNGKSLFLGLFSAKSEAVLARKQAEKKLGYHKNHGRVQA